MTARSYIPYITDHHSAFLVVNQKVFLNSSLYYLGLFYVLGFAPWELSHELRKLKSLGEIINSVILIRLEGRHNILNGQHLRSSGKEMDLPVYDSLQFQWTKSDINGSVTLTVF